MPLSPSRIITSQMVLMLYGWEDNRGAGGKKAQPIARFMTISPAG